MDEMYVELVLLWIVGGKVVVCAPGCFVLPVHIGVGLGAVPEEISWDQKISRAPLRAAMRLRRVKRRKCGGSWESFGLSTCEGFKVRERRVELETGLV